MEQMRTKLCDHFTSPSCEAIKAHEANITAAATAAATCHEDPDATDDDINCVDAALFTANEPFHFPVNYAFSPNGCEILAHTLDSLHEMCPANHSLPDDIA